MDTSLAWINQYLKPTPVDAHAAEQALTDAGFPVEESHTLEDGDIFMDVEVTSNRGDCLCHLGLAREIAAVTDRTLDLPSFDVSSIESDIPVSQMLSLENTVPDACPLFTARVITGVKVGPSPDWLVKRLTAIGQRSINNVVDITNWITFELGNPCHVFDLDKLQGSKLIVRQASANEPLKTLDDKDRTLKHNEIVVADGAVAQSLAGVIGGSDSQVTSSTTSIVLEVATWDPSLVRNAARRHAIRTDASHRFERIVSPATLVDASARAASLIVELANGSLCKGILTEGKPLPELAVVSLRPSRCNLVLGISIPTPDICQLLTRLDFMVEQLGDDQLSCTVPANRPDISREIDLIEEIARTHNLSHIPLKDQLLIRVTSPQQSEQGMRHLADLLTGQGFYEIITFSFVSTKDAQGFIAPSLETVAVDEQRRKGAPTLRPSVLMSLLACRGVNQAARNHVPGGIRLYETASVFAQTQGSLDSFEKQTLALLLDVTGKGQDARQLALRQLIGAVESIASTLTSKSITIKPSKPDTKAFDPDATGRVLLDNQPIGWIGLASGWAMKLHDLDQPVVLGELDLNALIEPYPPTRRASTLPAFPGIERDLSVVVDETVTWDQIRIVVDKVNPALCQGAEFVSTFRGKQIGPGSKSVTLRLQFRDESRTLRHEEVDPQTQAVVDQLKQDLNAELRQ